MLYCSYHVTVRRHISKNHAGGVLQRELRATAHPDTLADSLKYLWKLSKYDSANVQFRVFSHVTPDTMDTTAWDSVKFDTLTMTPNKVHEAWLLEHKELYADTTFSFFCEAVLIDSTDKQYNQSKYSDTIHVFIPVLPMGKPIELIVIKVPME